MEKLQQILNKCRCGVYLTVNRHRNLYESAGEYLLSLQGLERLPEIEIREVMEKTNTIIELQFYPHTPIGSYTIYHYDLDKLLDKALEILAGE